jgi:GNAT superfamily N-acetyltransferase
MRRRTNELPLHEIIAANEANLFEHSLALGRTESGETYDGPEIKWACTGGPHLNRIFGARFGEEDVDAQIAAALRKFRTQQLPVVWIIGPSTQPSDLGARLERHGFTPAPEWAGMSLDLSMVPESSPLSASLTIEEVTDNSAIRTWALAPYGISEAPEPWAEAFSQVFTNLGCSEQDAWHFYLGYWHGEPVARSMLHVAAGVAGIYWVATAEKARRQGIGTALTYQALSDARAMGHRLAILQASAMGESIYRQMGFTEQCKMDVSIWRP